MVDHPDDISAHSGRRNPKRARLQPARGRGRRRQKLPPDSSPRHAAVGTTNHFDAQIMPGVASHLESTGHGDFDPSIVASYKAWKRAGNPHDPVCFECKEPGDIDHCETCRRSYHDRCKPNGSTYSNQEGIRCWYCSVCVDRRWHVAPPHLTPPASPRAFSVTEDVHPNLSPVYSPPARNVNPARPEPELEMQRVPIARTLAASNAKGSSAGSTTPGPLTITADIGSALVGSAALPAESGVYGGQSLHASSPARIPNRGRAQRMSRYSTLSKDVDSALWTLHCELEHIPLLQQKISELETETSSLRQQLRMRLNELALIQGIVDKARAAEAEVDRLRVEVTNKQMESEEIETLRTINQEIESELANSRREVEASRQTLQEWKFKLSSMLAD